MQPNLPAVDEESPLLAGQRQLKGNTVYIYLVACLSAIGGFLFGYDTGIISGAMIFIKEVFNLNEWWQESIVSSTLLAAWFFSILAGSATDRFGRKPVIVCSSFIFVAGSLIMAFAWDHTLLLLGRLVVGAAVGLASMTVPMYIAEIAPSGIRGQLVMLNICCITGGQFFASIIAYWFSFIKDGEGWRFMLGFAALPAAIQFFAFLAMPESPRWLIGNMRYTEAKEVLAKIRPKQADTEAEFEAIKENFEEAKREQDAFKDPNQSTMQRILATQPVRKALLVGCLLQFVQQLSGINTVMYYTATIFEMSGVKSKQEALLMSSGTALVNFVFTILGYALVERMGRRKLTLFSLFGVIVSLAIIGAGFQFAYVNSPQTSYLESSDLNKPCSSYGSCSACSRDPECGFCFDESNSGSYSISSASCLHVNTTHHDRSLLGNCTLGSSENYSNNSFSAGSSSYLMGQTTEVSTVWAYEWCPSAYSWVTLFGMLLYLLFFAPGMGPMPWTINSEIYPSWARSWCLSASTSVNWLSCLMVSMTFLSLSRAITKHGAFYLYTTLALVGFVYFACVLPETRGKTLEQLENLFADSKQTCSRRLEAKNKQLRA